MGGFFFFDARLCPTLGEIRYVLGEQTDATPSMKSFDDEIGSKRGRPMVFSEQLRKFSTRPRSAEEIQTFLDGLDTRSLWDMGMRYWLSEVADFLNVSSTRLKLLCRERGISQWPRRSAISLESIIRFPRTREKEKRILETLLAESFHNRFEFRGEAKGVFEKCKKRMYRFRHKLKTSEGPDGH